MNRLPAPSAAAAALSGIRRTIFSTKQKGEAAPLLFPYAFRLSLRLSSRVSRSAIMAMNSLFVGFPLVLETV